MLTPLTAHPLRAVLHEEAHARPFPVLCSPVRVAHFAVLVGEQGKEAEAAHVATLFRHFGKELPATPASWCTGQLGEFEFRWERHTEFSTYTLLWPGPYPHPFAPSTLSLVPADWLAGIRGQVLPALHIAMDAPQPSPRTRDDLHQVFDNHRLIGSHAVHDDALIWSAFRLHNDGFGRILIEDRSLNECRAGRLLQRLFELETYRLMALLALPLARDVGPQLTAMDQALAHTIAAIADVQGQEDERRLLRELSDFAARSEHIRAQTNYRFSATRAYHTLVKRRLEELRETQIAGLQTFAEFLDRRLTPAMNTCESVCDRLEDLSRRIDRATDLLRTRVQLDLEDQNQELLASMNRRARLQLRLQHAVEGLSVVVLSYYLLGLIKYALAALEKLGWPIESTLTTGVLMPIIVIGVWLGIRRLRRRALAAEE